MTPRQPPLSARRAGFCRWCDEAIEPRLKKNGQPHKRQASMHRWCADEYGLAQNVSRWRGALVKRDGDQCTECGPDGKFLQVDHVVPLWKVADLEPAQRRQYFLLGNLQLLCFDCHKQKSAKETAERAHHRRLAKGPRQRKGRAMQSRPFGPSRKFDGTVEVRT